jgi:hypothetical protein
MVVVALPGRPHRRRWVVAVTWLIVAACSSGDDAAPAASDTAPPATTAKPTTSLATSAPTTAPPPADTSATPTEGSPLTSSDLAAITDSFTVFFGGQMSTVDDKIAVLEDGESYRSMLEAASANEQFQQMSVDVREVRAGGDDECQALGAAPGCAVVTYDLLVGGYPMAAAIDGPAVRGDGSWLVGAAAWCHVVEIGGAACPDATPATGTP